MFDNIRLLQGSWLTCLLFSEGVGKKRKAPGQNSSESSSQLEDTTIGDKTQQVNAHRSYLLYSVTSHTWREAWPLLQEPPEKETRHGTTLVSYRAFFRELDLEVLRMLQYGLLSRSLLDSEQQTNVRPLLYSLGGESLLFMGFVWIELIKILCKVKLFRMSLTSLIVFLWD